MSEGSPVRGSRLVLWLGITLIAYLGVGALCFEAARRTPHASLLWLPTGISVAAAVLLGMRALPVIWLAAFIMVASISLRIGRTDALLYVQSALIALGNVGEAAAAAWLIRLLRVDPRLASFRSVFLFLLIAAGLAPLISATVGVGSIILLGRSRITSFPELWSHWWVGNALGVATLASALVACASGRAWTRLSSSRINEATLAFLALAATSFFAFLSQQTTATSFATAYLPLPIVLWLAVRLSPCGAAWGATLMAAAAVLGAVLHRGPFADAPIGGNPELMFALYLAVVTVTALLIAGLVTERETAMHELSERESRYRTLASATNDAVYDWDMSTNTLWWGEGMQRLFGYAESEVRPDLDWWESSIHPDDRKHVLADLQHAIDADVRDWEMEYRFRRADGNYATVIDRGVFLRAKNGKPTRMIGGMTDVSRRREAERLSRETEERLTATLDAAQLGAYDWDIPAGHIVWSGHHSEIFGYAPGQFDGTYEMFRARVHPDDVPQLEKLVEHARTGHGLFEHEYRLVIPDKGVRWVRGRGHFIYNEAGSAVRMLGIVTDITNVREAEEATRRAQERERLISSALKVVLWEADPRTLQFTYVSDEAANLLGRPLEDWLAPGFWPNAIHEEDREWAMSFCANATARGEDHEFDYRMRRADGTVVWVRDIVAVETNEGAPARLSGMLIDVTHLKQAEQAVERSRRQLRSIIEHSPLAYIEWDADIRVRVWSKRAEHMFGWTSDELLGRHYGSWRFVYEADASAIDAIAQRIMSGEVKHTIVRGRYHHKDGSLLHCEWYCWVTFDDAGNPLAVHSLAQDITERVQAEQRQIFMMQELDHRVKNNLAAILSLADATARASTTLDDFRSAFNGRLRALARTHALLARSRWSGVRIGDLVGETLAPYSDPMGPRVDTDGPNALLPPRAAAPLCMALHELATNAIKYGSLTVSSGVVTVQWSITGDENAPDSLDLTWTERGGPPVAPPTRRGFGATLITDAISHELGGNAVITMDTDGLVCRITTPLPPPPASQADFHTEGETSTKKELLG
ncbi:MAG: PAS domain-containing protein [Phycisphaerales bacterium]